MITIYGGKPTTFRHLAEATLAQLTPYFPNIKSPWTATALLPGGAIARTETDKTANALSQSYPFLPTLLLSRYLSAYGSDVMDMLSAVSSITDMGRHFGHNLYQIEVTYLIQHEWASSAEDILWRRSKLGLKFTPDQVAILEHWLTAEFGVIGILK